MFSPHFAMCMSAQKVSTVGTLKRKTAAPGLRQSSLLEARCELTRVQHTWGHGKSTAMREFRERRWSCLENVAL